MNKLLTVLGASALASALSGCGGGDDATPAPPPAATAAVPSSASATVAGMVSYLQALIAAGASADTLQPVDVSNVTLPTDETASPTSVD